MNSADKTEQNKQSFGEGWFAVDLDDQGIKFVDDGNFRRGERWKTHLLWSDIKEAKAGYFYVGGMGEEKMYMVEFTLKDHFKPIESRSEWEIKLFGEYVPKAYLGLRQFDKLTREKLLDVVYKKIQCQSQNSLRDI